MRFEAPGVCEASLRVSADREHIDGPFPRRIRHGHSNEFGAQVPTVEPVQVQYHLTKLLMLAHRAWLQHHTNGCRTGDLSPLLQGRFLSNLRARQLQALCQPFSLVSTV
jgi:hypothetical protein